MCADKIVSRQRIVWDLLIHHSLVGNRAGESMIYGDVTGYLDVDMKF